MASRSRKHVSLIVEKSHQKGTLYHLVGPDSQKIEAFTQFVKSIMRKDSNNTVRSYSIAVADFYDYFFEAASISTYKRSGQDLLKSQLREIVELFGEYLTLGGNSSDDFVKSIDRGLPSPLIKPSSANLKIAALSRFLYFSERIRKENLELSQVFELESSFDKSSLFIDFEKHKLVTSTQKTRMMESSVIAGVIAGGPKQTKEKLIDHFPATKYDGRNSFPFEFFGSFTAALTTYRDKAIFCFYAASGCRSNECLQLLWDDIDFNLGKVRLVDPKSRLNDLSYLSLSPLDREKLSWKGRAIDMTFLIEPFASLFFQYLALYLEKEYRCHGKHRFIFQILKGTNKGKPYFCTQPATRQEVFNKAAQVIGLDDYIRGPHSLRHAYATYLLNYIPVKNGEFGLPISMVKVLMGHESIKTTSKYAKEDIDLVELNLVFASGEALLGNHALNVNRLKALAIQAQIAKLNDLKKHLGEQTE